MSKKEAILMNYNGETGIYSSDKLVCKQEFLTRTPSGDSLDGKWVLRDTNGILIDYASFRNDIFERNNIITTNAVS